MARRATSSIPTAAPAGGALIKRQLCSPKWNRLSLPYRRRHCHHLAFFCLGRHKEQSRITFSAPFRGAMDVKLLIYSLTAKHKAATGIWDFFADYSYTQKAEKEERIFFQNLIFHKEFPFSSTDFFFLPLKEVPSQFQFTFISNNTCFPILQNIWVSISGCFLFQFHLIRKIRRSWPRRGEINSFFPVIKLRQSEYSTVTEKKINPRRVVFFSRKLRTKPNKIFLLGKSFMWKSLTSSRNNWDIITGH